MQREQKTEQSGCSAEDRVEPEGTQGAQSIVIIRKTENGDSAIGRGLKSEASERSLLEAILDINNMFNASERVISNRGSVGTDGMTVSELNGYLIKHYRELCESIRGGWYKPKPVKCV